MFQILFLIKTAMDLFPLVLTAISIHLKQKLDAIGKKLKFQYGILVNYYQDCRRYFHRRQIVPTHNKLEHLILLIQDYTLFVCNFILHQIGLGLLFSLFQ